MMMRLWPVLAFVMATPAVAQTSGGAWKVDQDRAVIVAAAIGLPVRAAVVSLVQTGEASQKGSGLDDIAQYHSADDAVEATAFVFFAAYADTALASMMTDYAIRERYGPNVALASENVVAAGGSSGAAIRRIYEHGTLRSGKPLATAAAFVRAGRWMVVLRVTGPEARRRDVESTIDALISGTSFDGKAKPLAAAPLRIEPSCPANDATSAKLLRVSKNSSANTLAGSLFGGAIRPEDADEGSKVFPLAFPQNGKSAVCVTGQVGKLKVVRGTDAANAATTLLPFNDAGGVLAVEPALIGRGYQVKRYGIGAMEILGTYDRVPTAIQLGAILDGSDKAGNRIAARTTFTPDGNSNVEIDSGAFK